MRRHTRQILAAGAGLFLLLVIGLGGYWVYGKLTRNEAASCANCRSFVGGLLDDYAAKHEGMYPVGGSNALDSLSKCVNEAREVHFFTSHAQAERLTACWQEHRTFTADLCCYRYIEGVRTNDPEGLVLLYYWQPTRWECTSHKRPEQGRAVCALGPAGEFRVSFGSWRFMPESEFQAELARTQAYLRDNHRVSSPQSVPDPSAQRTRDSRSFQFGQQWPRAAGLRR